jgi:hypothetical protein
VRVSRRDVAALVDIELWREKRCLFKVTSRPITARQPTTFRAGIEIPADFLNELSYQARFRVRAVDMSGSGGTEVVTAEERLDFAAMNPNPEESVWNDWPWNRNGLISPRLSWTVHEA